MESKTNSKGKRSDLWCPKEEGERKGKFEEGGQNVQTSSFKINKYCGSVQHDDYANTAV